MTRRYLLLQLAASLFCALLAGTAAAQPTAEHRAQLSKDAQDTFARYRKADPDIERFFKDSVGYAVFPRVGKVGFIFGAGHGDGETYERGKLIGTCSITLATVGLQAGAQEFSEIIFFQDQAALDRFKQNKFEFTANVSAVIVKAGASKAANYRDGVAVFSQPRGGVMAEIALGAQKLSFKPETGSAKK